MIRKFHRRLVISNVLLMMLFGFVAIIGAYFNTRGIGLLNIIPDYYVENTGIIILSLIGILRMIYNLWRLEASHELV